MAVLNLEIQEKIDSLADLAYDKLQEGNLKDARKFREQAWELYPEPKENWNENYNTAKYFFEDCLGIKDFDEAKMWLNKMIAQNNIQHNNDAGLWFYVGKYHFETGNYTEAHDKWKAVVQDAGYRYFEDEDPKYLDFYKNPQKYMK
jgi:tetratricopeptide (TPR) repeat protein